MKFGWCNDGHHAQCRVSYVDWNKKPMVCDCTCHTEQPAVEETPTPKPRTRKKKS